MGRGLGLRAVIVLLAGLTCDSKCYARGERVEDPGPELLEHARPGAVHWTGARAARFADERGSEVDVASPLGSVAGVSAPPGSVVILFEGLTADNRVWHRNEVVSDPGPELLAHCEPGVVHWSTHKPAAYLVPGQGALQPVTLVPDTVPIPEKAERMLNLLADLRMGMPLDELKERHAITKGEARLLGLDNLAPEKSPEAAQDSGQEGASSSEPANEVAEEVSSPEAPQEPSGEVAPEVQKDSF